jgi:tRNA threonylcarbamoyladenosine biosynthesis protein TsaE
MRVHEVATAGPDETEALGEALGRTATGRELVGLVGDLGAGKTCLVRGLARGLGADPTAVHSPTFTIATEYDGGRLPLTHVDLYRLERPQDDELFFRDVLYGEGVAAVEWFDRLLPAASQNNTGDLPDDVLVIRLGLGPRTEPDHRHVRLEAHGARHERWLARTFGA